MKLRTTVRPVMLSTAVLAGLALTGCAENAKPADASDPRAVTVNSTADACEVSKTDVPAGAASFEVTNNGDQVTEFYVLASDGLRIVGEVENIGPKLSRTLTINLAEGSYTTACKPGMKGDGIRADFTVSKSDEKVVVSEDKQKLIDAAEKNYVVYVRDQADQLLTATTEFLDLYTAGKDDEARALYPLARMHWERIEPVAESFGDLDPEMDLREADVEEGAKWTGWHLIEKDLWPETATDYTALTPAERQSYADNLLANTEKLDKLVAAEDFTFSVDKIANGASALLEEIASGKVTGEEEIWSGTDLYDFKGNLEGADVAYQGVRDIIVESDADLVETLDSRFAALTSMLKEYEDGKGGYVDYAGVDETKRKELSDAVSALSEPLSRLGAAVLGA